MRSNTLRSLLIVLLAWLAGCVPSLYMPSVQDAAPGTSLEELLRGREEYIQQCGSCHSLYIPGRFRESEWRSALDSMQPRAHIDDTAKARILHYILTGRAKDAPRD
jgi:mono/diheme cytochrome c family protein